MPTVTAEAGAGGSAGDGSVCDDAADLDSDAENCGRCGHDCLGGECEFGKCLPVTVAASQTNPIDVATDGTYVYWSGSDSEKKKYYVASRRVDFSDDVKIIATAEVSAHGLTVGNGAVYWWSSGQLRVCQSPDCADGPSDFASAQARPALQCSQSMISSSGRVLQLMARVTAGSGARPRHHPRRCRFSPAPLIRRRS